MIKQCKNLRKPLPDFILEKIRNKPKLAFGLEFYLDGFWNLCTERPQVEGMAMIPWSKIQAYSDYYELEFEEAEEFHHIIKRIDNAYVNQMRTNGKQPSKPTTAT